MSLVLRPYQADLVERVNARWEAGARAVLMQLGTGGGKTATASEVLRRATANGYRSLFLAHLDALITDTHARLTAAGVHAGYMQAGRPSDESAPVQVASLQTLHARGIRPTADLVILDECHRAMGPTVRGILDDYPDAAILGLTATPQRGDGQPLGDVFEAMVCGPSNRELVAAGHLVPCELLAPGQFEEEGLAMDPVAAYREHTPGARALVFAANIEHADAIAASFRSTFWTAEVLTGETPRGKREDMRARMREGALDVLIGVGVFIEGWDEPSVSSIILARPFSVTGSYLQAIGRGLRPSEGKTKCTVIDLRGSVVLHGLPEEDRVWSLEGRAVRRLDVKTALRRCRECLAVFTPRRVCPRCGSAATSAAKVPRVLNRAERLAKWNDVPEGEREKKYVDAIYWRLRRRGMSEGQARSIAREGARKRFQRNGRPGANASGRE